MDIGNVRMPLRGHSILDAVMMVMTVHVIETFGRYLQLLEIFIIGF